MAIDVTEASKVDQRGLAITDETDNVLLYVTAGFGSPVGLQAPVPTLYVDNLGNIWRKLGPNQKDWVELKDFISGQRLIDVGETLNLTLNAESRVRRFLTNCGVLRTEGILIID